MNHKLIPHNEHNSTGNKAYHPGNRKTESNLAYDPNWLSAVSQKARTEICRLEIGLRQAIPFIIKYNIP